MSDRVDGRIAVSSGSDRKPPLPSGYQSSDAAQTETDGSQGGFGRLSLSEVYARERTHLGLPTEIVRGVAAETGRFGLTEP